MLTDLYKYVENNIFIADSAEHCVSICVKFYILFGKTKVYTSRCTKILTKAYYTCTFENNSRRLLLYIKYYTARIR